MMLQRWNYVTKSYEPFEVPDDRKAVISADAKEMVNCACCGREIPFYLSYTSFEIHNSAGLGYAVCEWCHYSENELRKICKKIDSMRDRLAEEREKFNGKAEG